MTKRTRTVLTLSVVIAVPAGKTQEQTLNWVRERLTRAPEHPEPVSDFISNRTLVRVAAKETVYL